MMHILENEILRVTIDPQGAELTSIIRKADGAEYVWQGDPTYWKRHAPVLFPIVGRLKGQSYTVGGQAYSITQHGFGRDLPFAVHPVSDTCAEFVLTENEHTKSMYPYDFTFTIRYTLEGASLKKEHITENRSAQPLYYEVGGHDAYNILMDGAPLASHYAAFEGVEQLSVIDVDDSVMLTRSHHTVPLQEGRLYLTRETFSHDALMLDELPVRRCTLGSTAHDRSVTMDFSDFPYFALWSPYRPEDDVPFVCLEPWSTLPDGSYLGQELEQKTGVRCVAPGAQETLAFTVTIA